MDKFKTMMQASDKGVAEEKTGPTGRLTGQGSHFPKREEQPAGDTTASQENTTAGDVLGTDAKQTSEADPASGPTDSGPGTAAIGETSTYSSRTLLKGDVVGNVVDSRSEDPTTYRVPEHSYVSSKGVPEGGPLAAAAHAFHKDKDYSTSHIPGAFPKDMTAHDATTIAPSSLTTTTSPAERSAAYSQAEKINVPDAAAAAQLATRDAPGTQEPILEEPRESGTIGKILGAVGLGTAATGAAAATTRAENAQPHAIVDTPDQPTTNTGVDSYTAPNRSGPPPSHHRKESIPTTAYPAGADSPAPINPPVGGTSAVTAPEQKDHPGRNAGLATAAVGVGASAGATAVYAMQDDAKETPRSDWPLRENATATTRAAAAVPSEGTTNVNPTSQPAEQDPPGHDAALVGAGASVVPEYSKRQDLLETQAQKDRAKQDAAIAGATSTEGGASIAPEYTERQDKVAEETERRRRKKEEEAALAGVAAAGAGAGAAGLYEYNQRQDKLEADVQRQNDLAEQEAARQKQFEKDQKATQKHAKKEEKHHQKELKKEEKHHQKELEKEEKAREKAAEKEEQTHRRELEHEQKEREKAAAAAAVGAGAYEVHNKDKHPPPTTATDESGHTKLHKEPEEKKPSLLKRIFRRRKNKDTGEEEEYEDHDHHEPEAEHGDHHRAAAGVAGGTGAAVAGAAAAASHEPATTSYEAPSGGLQKPSYNPFSQDDPARESGTVTSSSAHAAANLAPQTPHSRRSSVGPDAIDPTTTHLPYDPVHDPSSRRSISEQGEHLDHIGGLTAHHPYAEGEHKPGLAHRIVDALKPLPDREELEQHAEEYHHHGHPTGTAQ